MKRIYMAIALIASFITGAHAQRENYYVDMEVVAEGFKTESGGSWVICDSTFIDTTIGILAIRNNGPDDVVTGDYLWVKTPYSDHEEYKESTVSGYEMTQTYQAGSFFFAMYDVPAADIKYLLNIEEWNREDTAKSWVDVLVSKDKLVDGQKYGWFLYAYRLGDIEATESAFDTIRSNNMKYDTIEWCGDATSIKDLFSGRLNDQLSIYPNPTTNSININYEFIKPSMASVRIMDISGRTVAVKDLGKNAAGKQAFKIDCSAIAPGTYFIELQTEERRAISKVMIR